jgi:hypothetical protein
MTHAELVAEVAAMLSEARFNLQPKRIEACQLLLKLLQNL